MDSRDGCLHSSIVNCEWFKFATAPPCHSLLVVHPTNALIVVCGFFGIGCLDSFKRPTPHPLTKRGIENIFDVPVLHLGVWVRIVDLNPHMFGTTPTVSLLLSGRLHRITSLYPLSAGKAEAMTSKNLGPVLALDVLI